VNITQKKEKPDKNRLKWRKVNIVRVAHGATAIARQKCSREGEEAKRPKQVPKERKSRMGTVRIPARSRTTVNTLAKYLETRTAPSQLQITQLSSSGHEIRREVHKAKNTEFRLQIPREAKAQAVKSSAMP
jgi:hypothetical protein